MEAKTFGFLLRNHKKGLVYDGDGKKLELCLDMKDALKRRKRAPNNFALTEIKLKIYGRETKLLLPVWDEKGGEHRNVTSNFLGYIIREAKNKLISDVSLGQWMEILKHYDVIQRTVASSTSNDDAGRVYFRPVGAKATATASSSNSQFSSNRILTTGDYINPTDPRVRSKYVLMKEFMDGYSYFDKYEYKVRGESEATPIDISFTYNIDDTIIPYNYTLALRKAMFGANQGQSIGPDKLLMDRQYQVILGQAKKTIVFGPRRAGKTFLLAFLARREIMAQKLNFQNQYRPVSVLYLGLNDMKNMKVVSYLQGMDKMFSKNAEGMFIWEAQKRMYSFKSGKETLGSITFLSAESKDPGVGDYADMIIIDEAVKIPQGIREGLEPIVTNEGAKLLTASTLYYDSPKGWNYDLMLEAEKNSLDKQTLIYNFIQDNWDKYFEYLTKKETWTMEDRREYQEAVNQWMDNNERAGLRFTIDDIEYIPEHRREAEKQRLRQNNPDRYYAEMYSRFADKGKVFNYNGCLFDVDANNAQLSLPKIYKDVAVVHDSADTFDTSACLVGARDAERKKVVILEEHEITKTGYYEDQAKEIQGIINASHRYSDSLYTNTPIEQLQTSTKDQIKAMSPNTPHIYFVCDGNQKATAELFQMAGVDIDYRMVYHGNSSAETSSRYIHNEINIPKSNLIDIAQKMLENGFILLNTKLQKLIREFDSYTKTINPATGAIKYVKGKTDDFIHAFMMLCYFYYEKLNLKIELVESSKQINYSMLETQGLTQEDLREIKQQQLKEQQKKQELQQRQEQNQVYFSNFVY